MRGACALALGVLALGAGTPPQAQESQALALPELRRAAEAGDARAQSALAHRYLAGAGVAVDVERAMQWLCRAVHHRPGGVRVGRALWYLATYFRTGGGVPGAEQLGERAREDPLRAYFWFGIQADQQRHFDSVHAESELLGRLGRSTLAPLLYPEERARIEAAVARWDPARPVRSGRACLRLPQGLPAAPPPP